MTTTTEQIRGDQLPPRLTIERDPVDHVAPSGNLISAQKSGEWPLFDFFDPMVGNSGILQARAITRYADGKAALSKGEGVRMGVLANAEEGSTAGTPGFLIYLEGDDHRRVNSILMRHFGMKRVRSMAPEITRIVDELLDEMEAAPERRIDIAKTFCAHLPVLVVSHLLGASYDDAADLERWSSAQVDMNLSAEEVFKAVAELHEYTRKLYYRAKETPGDDLMSAIATDYSAEMTEEEAIGLAFTIFSAAIDTTARFGALAILSILRFPEQRAHVEAAGEVTEAMVDELLRYLSPATSAQQRYLLEDLEVGSNEVKAGNRFMVSLLAANWDPDFIGENPGLDLTRRKTPHLTFSAGTHACAGQHLARLEMQIALTKLFQRFPTLELDTEIDDLEWMINDQIYFTKTLPVRW